MEARYAGVMPNDTVDCLQGICVSFWTQGCPHHCMGCHNPETWSRDGGYILPENYIERVIELLGENGINRALSILGGEPMAEYNIPIILPLVRKVKEESPETTIYLWSGYTYEDLLERPDAADVLSYVDILIDGPFVLENRDITLPLRGSPNQRVVDVQRSRRGKVEII